MIVHYVLVAIFVKISTLDKRWTKKWWGHLIVDLKMGIFPKNPRIRSHINKFAKVMCIVFPFGSISHIITLNKVVRTLVVATFVVLT